jgi:hypothetical protein
MFVHISDILIISVMLVTSLRAYMLLENLLQNCTRAYFSQDNGHRNVAPLSKYLFEFYSDGIVGIPCVCMCMMFLCNINMFY